MSNFPIIDLVLGMIFFFFLFSILSSSLVEFLMSYKNVRSTILTKWLLQTFDKKVEQPDGKIVPLGQAIMDHSSLTALSKAGSATTFIDAKNFSSALIEKITFRVEDPTNVPATLDQIKDSICSAKAIDGMPMVSIELQRTFLLYVNEAKFTPPPSTMPLDNATGSTSTATNDNNIEAFRKKLEDWFNSSMDRVTGRLVKQFARPFTLVTGIVMTLLLNADSVKLVKYLYDHKDETTRIANQAAMVSRDTAVKALMVKIDSQVKLDSASAAKLDALVKTNYDSLTSVFPLGWSEAEWKNTTSSGVNVFLKIVGLFVTILAIMVGAPFWFDVLNKIANLRGAGPKPVAQKPAG